MSGTGVLADSWCAAERSKSWRVGIHNHLPASQPVIFSAFLPRDPLMTATAQTLRPPSRTLMFLEGRAIHEFGAFLGALPLLSLAPRGDGHPVLVLPGLVASDGSTRALRTFLSGKGYAVSGWSQGRNYGLREGVQHAMVDLLCELNDIQGRKVSLVGWSLGGLYARQLAKMMPDRVRQVITLGSPFASNPKAT